MSDARAVSTTLSYVLSLGIATVLITGLIVAGGSYIDSQREQVIRDELTVTGQQIASDIEWADRLVRAGDSAVTVRTNRSFSNSVTGAPYRVTLDDDNETVVLRTTDPDVTVRIGLAVETPLAESSILGGDLQVRYTGSELEVRDV
ncbi:DUF7266 family protein [Haloarcula laminariae]|uniref:DUF7266 family protein n=1 Tax=Haloarcula laminariae TaxID=2961577 RepID=UPI0021C592A4|nr:hypothetical protein [Halomicroarcula laminariae]